MHTFFFPAFLEQKYKNFTSSKTHQAFNQQRLSSVRWKVMYESVIINIQQRNKLVTDNRRTYRRTYRQTINKHIDAKL